MITTLTHDQLDQLSERQLRTRLREVERALVDAAYDMAYGRPDFPAARAALDQSVFRHEDTAQAIKAKRRTA